MFCVECGREGRVFEALCPACFFERKKLVELPKIIDLTVCSSCNSLFVDNKWARDELEPTIDRLVSSSLWHNPSVEVLGLVVQKRFEDAKNLSADVTVKVGLNGNEKEVHEHLRVRMKSGTCPVCSKRHGKYYEAIVQIRPGSEELGVEVLNEIRDYVHSRMGGAVESGAFVSKEEAVHGGVDFYLSSNKIAKSIAKELGRRFGVKVSASPKIHGRVKGREVYRVTYIVRLP